ncbi:MAG: YihY/virulence factor BrkB family protein [Actinobacteria bacterium]|nr:YihY/virulence factor BrkB family protein [Actinomycetota bacterium]
MSGTPAVEPRGRIARLLHGPVDAAVGVLLALALAIEGLFRDRAPQYAAAIAFHVLFSLFPLTILLVSIFGLVLQDDELRASVIDELLAVLPVSPSGEEDVRSSIEQIASPFSAFGLLFLIALLWGASGMMAAIRVGLESALKADRRRPAAHAKLVDFVLVGVTGVLVLAVIGLSAFATLFSRAVDSISERLGVDVITSPTGALIRDLVQLVLIAVMTLMLYRVAPGRKLRRSAALAGAILTAVGIWGAAKLLAILVDVSRYNVIYGSIAGVMTFLIFVYVVALILLLGAEFAYEWSQPPGPPGPPIGARFKGFLRGLVVYEEPENTGDVEDDLFPRP